MRAFDNNILEHLNGSCQGEAISFVGLGAYDFQLTYPSISRLQATFKVVFSLQGKTYTWQEGASAAPVWLLIGQIPTQFTIPSPYILRMNLQSGDWVEFHSEESPYECMAVEIGPAGDTFIAEYF